MFWKWSRQIGFCAIGMLAMTGESAIPTKNNEKFDSLREFNLPIDQYAIISSGPMGIRGLREMGDVDIIVTPELWEILAAKYGIVDTGSRKKIDFPGGLIEAFCEHSFYLEEKVDSDPAMAERISQAEIISGLPFDSLENVLYYKRKWGREKDLEDIFIIEQFLKGAP